MGFARTEFRGGQYLQSFVSLAPDPGGPDRWILGDRGALAPDARGGLENYGAYDHQRVASDQASDRCTSVDCSPASKGDGNQFIKTSSDSVRASDGDGRDVLPWANVHPSQGCRNALCGDGILPLGSLVVDAISLVQDAKDYREKQLPRTAVVLLI